MSNKIRVGILGCAAIAKRSLAPAFAAHKDFDLVAVASRDIVKAKAFADDYGARPCTYDDLIVADDISLIYCPLPTGLHAEWVAKALRQGKHVLCEKSLATTFSDVESLVRLAQEKNLFLMESFQFRFHEQNLYVKKILRENVLGEIRQVLVRFGIPPFPEGGRNIRYSQDLGGGALLDNGAYTIKAATYLLGEKVRVMSAFIGSGKKSLGNVDLTGGMMLCSDEGVLVQTAYGFDHYYQNGYEIWGTKGKIVTTRAFTARQDFAAPVIVETAFGRDERKFIDDHFSKLLDYVSGAITSGCFQAEYDECLLQARILAAAAQAGGLR